MKKLFALFALMAMLSGFTAATYADEAAPAAGTAMEAPAAAPAAPAPAPAAEAPKLDTGATAWMLSSTALVLLMTIPGLALFYGGMVRKKNVLDTMMQSFAITSLITVVWMVAGYSIAFDTTGMEKGVTNFYSFFGSLNHLFLSGMNMDSMTASIPESVLDA